MPPSRTARSRRDKGMAASVRSCRSAGMAGLASALAVSRRGGLSGVGDGECRPQVRSVCLRFGIGFGGFVAAAMRLMGLCQLVIRRFLEGDHRVICVGKGVQNLVEFALRDEFLARLRVLNDEYHREGQRRDQCLEDRIEASGKADGSAPGQPHRVNPDDDQCKNRPRHKGIYPVQQFTSGTTDV